ncbi:hypothetical protein [Sphingomonas sp. BE137]|uniref:hypothetical protein n=1 Tax=Sphingomonas sp. BE137 TaxID=2817844 RepID=UPI001AE77927|nr:hypothetical protein [Sphingomonas sp. BE137]MDR6850359.1 hypothetical protein [Sphingomonas sp. BE137]
MLKIDLSADLKPLQKAFKDFRKEQVPFATALALTKLAQGVVAVEQGEIKKTFDSPTPFTQKSITMKSATKRDLTAIIYPRERAESYLEPYVIGGNRSLGNKKGMLVPKNVAVNQYGNLTRNKLASLKGKPGVFIGKVRTKKGGIIGGVWQRMGPARSVRGKRKGQAAQPAGHLKLLIRFEDTTPVPRRLPFYQAAQSYLKANYRQAFADAMAQALRTRKG